MCKDLIYVIIMPTALQLKNLMSFGVRTIFSDVRLMSLGTHVP